jgi:hypothetical protein
MSKETIEEVRARIEEEMRIYNLPENRIMRVHEFMKSLPEGRSSVYVRVVENGQEDKYALLGSEDFKEFLKDYDRISKLVG